ncbi:glycine betaine/proline transport system substrate-binding protein [Pseudomonas sp. TE3786]
MNEQRQHFPILRLGVTDLSFHRATAAVVTEVLQRMGFVVQRSYALHEENFAQLRAGTIDMLASAWLPHSHGIYQASVEKTVATRELGLHYQPYALWGVPEHVPAAAVQSIQDLLEPAVLARMQCRTQGIGAGAGISRFSQRIMQEYGLGAAGYTFHTGTEMDCWAAFERLVITGEWGVVPLWQPQFLHHQYAIRELQDPRMLLGGVDRAVLLAREDRLALLGPEQVQVLANIRLSNAIVAELDYAINRGEKTPDQAAHDWLCQQPEALAQWFAPLAMQVRSTP